MSTQKQNPSMFKNEKYKSPKPKKGYKNNDSSNHSHNSIVRNGGVVEPAKKSNKKLV